MRKRPATTVATRAYIGLVSGATPWIQIQDGKNATFLFAVSCCVMSIISGIYVKPSKQVIRNKINVK